MRLGVSPSGASTPTGVFNQRCEALFPRAGALGCAVCFAPPAVPPSLSMCKCRAAGSASHLLVGSATCSLACPVPQSATLLGPPAAALLRVLVALAVSTAPPTGLDECFFFISLVVGPPYSSIFCQFWLFFVFKLLLSFFWLCKVGQCIYLHLHLGRKWLNVSLFGSDLFNLTMFKLSVFYLVLYCVFFKSIPRNLSASIVHVCL